MAEYFTEQAKCDMAEYFMSRLIYFQGVKIKPESEISCHIILTSVMKYSAISHSLLM